MTEQNERRVSQAIFYDAISDRRRPARRPELDWQEPTVPGAIRPGVQDEWDGVERRRMPEAGTE
jgi:hypothetical protein